MTRVAIAWRSIIAKQKKKECGATEKVFYFLNPGMLEARGASNFAVPRAKACSKEKCPDQ